MRPFLTPSSITRIERGDKKYPPRLNDLHDPPKEIYIDGDIELLQMPMIAIVGARKASAEGLKPQPSLHKGSLMRVYWLSPGSQGVLMVQPIKPP